MIQKTMCRYWQKLTGVRDPALNHPAAPEPSLTLQSWGSPRRSDSTNAKAENPGHSQASPTICGFALMIQIFKQ